MLGADASEATKNVSGFESRHYGVRNLAEGRAVNHAVTIP